MRDLVYISYSSRDAKFRDELREVLLSDIRLHDIVWDDKKIPIGADWRQEIHLHVARARIMIMMVSEAYLAPTSKTWEFSIPQALEAHKKGVLTIMWVPVSKVATHATPFANIQAALPPSQPLDSMNDSERDAAYLQIKNAILNLLALDQTRRFDAFLSHNSRDKLAVRELGNVLKKRGISVWLDEWELIPGRTWQDALEEIITNCRAAIVCVGENGIGPWEDPEMQALLRRFVKEKKLGNTVPIIPVILPGAPGGVTLPIFLEGFMWTDLRNGMTREGIDRLQWGVTGVKPKPQDIRDNQFANVNPQTTTIRDGINNDHTSVVKRLYDNGSRTSEAKQTLANNSLNQSGTPRDVSGEDSPDLAVAETTARTVNATAHASTEASSETRKADGLDTRQKEVILLVHGIRTFASWQPMVKRVLEEIPNTKVVPIKYGYLDAFRFWFPFLTRQAAIDDLRREIQNSKATNLNARISVIAHSFGTYAVSRILVENPDITLHRLILSGAIIPRSYRWDYVRERLMTEVLNDFGTRDIWPVLAKCLSWGYGDTGRHGFGRVGVTDRAHDYTHSDFFNEKFVRDYWKPWFETDKIVSSPWEEKAPPSPWFLSLLSVIPLQWIICAAAIVASVSLSGIIKLPHPQTNAKDPGSVSNSSQRSPSLPSPKDSINTPIATAATEKEVNDATDFLEGICDIIEKRFCSLQSVLEAIQNKADKQQLTLALNSHDDTKRLFRERASKDNALLKLHFGEAIREDFQTKIAGEFDVLDDYAVESVKLERVTEDAKRSQVVLDSMIHRFIVTLMNRVHSKTVGVSQSDEGIDDVLPVEMQRNHPDTSLTQALVPLKGKIVLLDCFSTWCAPCLIQLPKLKNKYLALKSTDFEVVSVSIFDDREKFDSFLSRNHLRILWPTVHLASKESKEFAEERKITGIPTYILIGLDGSECHRFYNIDDLDEALVQKAILAGSEKSD